MDFVMTFSVIALFILIACIVAYAHNANCIIKIQEKQIARLNTENLRLKASLQKVSGGKAAQVIEIHDKTVDPENVPDFDKEW